jgi:hypothetical protein
MLIIMLISDVERRCAGVGHIYSANSGFLQPIYLVTGLNIGGSRGHPHRIEHVPRRL